MLITGSNSGLGKYIHTAWRCAGLTRATDWKAIQAMAERAPFEVIIHCAANTRRDITSESFYAYLQDNILLTQSLLQLPHKKFVYISSVDVYPETNMVHDENEVIVVDKIGSLYGVIKLACESLVRAMQPNHIILRPTAMLGRDAKPNSLIKILQSDAPLKLTLSAESSFNYILHEEILQFIQIALDRHLTGTFNLAAADNIQLGEAVAKLQKEVLFGQYTYKTGQINQEKAAEIFHAYKDTTWMNIQKFQKKHMEKIINVAHP
jgi:nucleoside-diphosphate-sugar epimerase